MSEPTGPDPQAPESPQGGPPVPPGAPGPPEPPRPSDPEGPSPEDFQEARALLRTGVALLPVMAVTLVLGLDMTVRDAVFASLLLGTLPLLTMAQLPLLSHGRVERIPAYTGSAVMLTVLASLGLLLGHFGPGLEAMGLGLEFSAREWRTVGVVLAAVVLLGVGFHFAEEWFGLEESPLLVELIPRTAKEKGLFALLSLAAGVGEEVVYRGYLLALLGPIFSGPWVAAATSTLAFAVLHAYQGAVGIVRSGLLGFLFAAAFIMTGSLWPVILVHAGVDLLSGLVLGPRMLERNEKQV